MRGARLASKHSLAAHQLARHGTACRAVGRELATLERTATVRIDLPGERHAPFGFFGGQAMGTPDELAALLRGYAEVGITHLQVALGPNTVAGMEVFAPVLMLLDRS